VRGVAVAVGGVGLTLVFFLVLPLLQAISAVPPADLMVTGIDTAALPPPPPPPPIEEEKPPEQEQEAKPPELTEAAPPLDLAQLELALNPGAGAGEGAGGDFAIKIQAIGGQGSDDGDALFSLADLEQKPRVLFQQQPQLTAAMRKKLPGTVAILFVVDPSGRVTNPIVQSASDPIFEAPALAAIKQWKFEPGKRSGKPVQFRMRVPMTFK
jgi:protein TonB